MNKYNTHVVERVARSLNEWEATAFGVNTWGHINDETQWQYRELAKAALEAIDSLYEFEAEEPVEYAGIEGGL